MAVHLVEENRPYRLIGDDRGRYAVVEARNGHVYGFDCGHPRAEAKDSPEGMARVVGEGWQDRDGAARLFKHMVEREEGYSQTIW